MAHIKRLFALMLCTTKMRQMIKKLHKKHKQKTKSTTSNVHVCVYCFVVSKRMQSSNDFNNAEKNYSATFTPAASQLIHKHTNRYIHSQNIVPH